MTIREKFFEDEGEGSYKRLKSNKYRFDIVWKVLEEFEKEIGKTIEEGFQREDYIKLFSKMEIRSGGTFSNYKTALLYYVNYLIANDVLPYDHNRILVSVRMDDLDITNSDTVSFIKNPAVLEKYVNATLATSDAYDYTIYYGAISAIYLEWAGLTEDEIINLKKSEVLDDCVIVGKKRISIDKNHIRIIHQYRDAVSYFQLAVSVAEYRYMNSQYLMRTRANAKMTKLSLQQTINRFNCITDRVYSLKYNTLHMSGIYYRAYLRELASVEFDLNDKKFASEVFCTDLTTNRSKRINTLRGYSLYKTLF